MTDSAKTLITVSDLPPEISAEPALEELAEVEIPASLKDAASRSDIEHRDFDESEFWRKIPAFRGVDRETFLDHRFQARNSVTSIAKLAEALGDRAPESFLGDAAEGIRRAPMNLRLTPYILARADWERPYEDPICRQFVPTASTFEPDHPRLRLDSLEEQSDAPTPGLVHRYPDKVLFLALDVCPVYCRFCTRSYAIGHDTEQVAKVSFKPTRERWKKAFAYLASRPEVEDVVVSGGDVYYLSAKHLRWIGEKLIAIPHIRRIRFATKGPAVMPMKILTDDEWVDALEWVTERGRERLMEVCLHVHFNSTAEISAMSRDAMARLFRRRIKVRNQSVLIRGVNDQPDEMISLVRQLSYMNVQPYYVYQHDMVKGVEELRTRVAEAAALELHVRGVTAGFNTPGFIVDLPGGGGKRGVHSHEYYDEATGVSVYRSPNVDESKYYLYFDPIRLLPQEGRSRWADPDQHEAIVEEAIDAAEISNPVSLFR